MGDSQDHAVDGRSGMEERVVRDHDVRRSRRGGERILLVGGGPIAQKIIEAIETQTRPWFSILGVVDDAKSIEHLSEIITAARPDRVVVALTERRRRLPVHQLLVAQVRDGIPIEDGVDVYERITGKLAIEALTPTSLVFGRDFRKSRFTLAAARVVSFIASGIGLLCLAPLLCLIALAIKVDSRGPVLFVHDRVGTRGKVFTLLKFRTMHAVDLEPPLWFTENRNQITRVGKWLRKFRLDELPQLFNVLRGDMNLVGPRPQRVAKFELLNLVARNTPDNGEAIPYYSLRSRVRPGMTGWAQVRYHYAHTLDEEIEKLRYDLFYIKHMSLWFDVGILFETLKMIVLGRGSSDAARLLAGQEGRAEAGGPESPKRPPADRYLAQDQDYVVSGD